MTHEVAKTAMWGGALILCALPAVADPITAQGNEPFWTVHLDDARMTIRRMGMDDLSLPVAQTMEGSEGAQTVMAADPDAALRAVLILSDTLCHDTMSGMPFPMTAQFEMGDTVMNGCAGDPLDLLTAGEWQVEHIADLGVLDAVPVTILFAEDGGVSGRGSCNRYFGDVTLTGEGLSFGPIGATRMACVEAVNRQEQRFFEALGRVTQFDIDETGALILRAIDGPVIIAHQVDAS